MLYVRTAWTAPVFVITHFDVSLSVDQQLPYVWPSYIARDHGFSVHLPSLFYQGQRTWEEHTVLVVP